MIAYETGGAYFLRNMLKYQGSVFPKALVVSVPSALLTVAFVTALRDWNMLGDHFKSEENENNVMNNSAIWTGFTFLVGFLVSFRTQQAYSRFWEGATQVSKMGAEWFDACSSLIAFCKHSTETPASVMSFQNMIIRLFSMLHAAALGEIEDSTGREDESGIQAFAMELIDAEAIDAQSLQAVRDSDNRVEMIFQWIQQYIVQNIRTGVLAIPPPILSRSFQEIATGMVHFQESMKISNVPFPFPYAQTCDALLMLHWLIVPFVVVQWCHKQWWAGLFAGLQVFTLWSLNLVAVELENPFGPDPNDIDGARLQQEYNGHLRMLIRQETLRTPFFDLGVGDGGDKISPQAALQSQVELTERASSVNLDIRRVKSFQAIWAEQAAPGKLVRRGTTMKALARHGGCATWVQGTRVGDESHSWTLANAFAEGHSIKSHQATTSIHNDITFSQRTREGSSSTGEKRDSGQRESGQSDNIEKRKSPSNHSDHSISSKKRVEIHEAQHNDQLSHGSALDPTQVSSLSGSVRFEERDNSPPQVMLGKWEAIDLCQMVDSQDKDVIQFQDLGDRLDEIFQQIENSEYGAEALLDEKAQMLL